MNRDSYREIACGIDIEPAGRIYKKWLKNQMPMEFFTDDELMAICSRPMFIEQCFTIKEAVLKSFGVGWLNSDIKARDIEIKLSSDHFVASLYGAAREIFYSCGYNSVMVNSTISEGFIVSQAVLYNSDNCFEYLTEIKNRKYASTDMPSIDVYSDTIYPLLRSLLKISSSRDSMTLAKAGLGNPVIIDRETRHIHRHIDVSISHSKNKLAVMTVKSN